MIINLTLRVNSSSVFDLCNSFSSPSFALDCSPAPSLSDYVDINDNISEKMANHKLTSSITRVFLRPCAVLRAMVAFRVLRLPLTVPPPLGVGFRAGPSVCPLLSCLTLKPSGVVVVLKEPVAVRLSLPWNFESG